MIRIVDPNILVVEDSPQFLKWYPAMLQPLCGNGHIDCAQSAQEAVDKFARYQYDYIVLDLMLGKERCFDLLSYFAEGSKPHNRVIVVSGELEHSVLYELARRGAWSFVPKIFDDQDMAAIFSLMIKFNLQHWHELPVPVFADNESPGWSPAFEPIDRMLANLGYNLTVVDCQNLIAKLSEQQLRVVRLSAKGRGNKEISREMGIAESVVKSHLAKAFKTMGVASRTRACAIYMAAEAGRYASAPARQQASSPFELQAGFGTH